MRDRSSSKKKHEHEPKQKPLPGNAKAGSSAVVLLVFLSLIVVGATLFAHWPVLSVNTLSFDDDENILQNHLIQNPSWHSAGRLFGEVSLYSVVTGYYIPITFTSLMLDWAMGGRPDNLYPFHRTSLVLHLGSTVLVILLCYQIFRRPIVAALVGLLFGVHPLTVEPIAWFTERKGLLASFFAFACFCSYVRYTRCGRWRWFAFALLLYLLSLLSKPSGIPLPIIMLLIDYWPLQRLGRRALLEKIPFFALAASLAVLTLVCENRASPLYISAKLSPLHLPLRLCWLIVFYPCKILLPIHLSSVYMLPQPLALTNGVVAAAVVGTIAMIVLLVISRRWTPALWAGAAMFYVGLAPTMGFVEYSWVVASDKYVYMPAVGLVLVLGWLLERLWQSGPDATAARRRRAAAVAVVLAIACVLGLGTRRYLSHWQTSERFITYMLRLAPNSPYLLSLYGCFLEANGQYEQAMEHYNRAIKLAPRFSYAYYNRGNNYKSLRQFDRAIRDYTKAIELRPDLAEAYNNRGNAYNDLGDFGRAIQDCDQAIKLKPECPEAYCNRANILNNMGNYREAVRDYTKAIEQNPGHAEAYYNRAVAHFYLKEYDRAWADVGMYRRLGGKPNSDLIGALNAATSRSE